MTAVAADATRLTRHDVIFRRSGRFLFRYKVLHVDKIIAVIENTLTLERVTRNLLYKSGDAWGVEFPKSKIYGWSESLQHEYDRAILLEKARKSIQWLIGRTGNLTNEELTQITQIHERLETSGRGRKRKPAKKGA
jgi:hypothetical protein